MGNNRTVPQSATALDIRNRSIPLPDYLLFDASMLLKYREGQIQDVNAFMTRARQAYLDGESYLLVCLSSLEECYHKILVWEYQKDQNLASRRIAVSGKWNKNNTKQRTPQDITWHELYKDSPDAIKRYVSSLEEFHKWLVGIPIHIIEPDDLSTTQSKTPSIEERMRYYTGTAYILTKDAWLVAQAERLGVYNIATTDRDFRRLGPAFTLYTLP